MQLPFVLQSAEVMKAAVAFLEPYIEEESDSTVIGQGHHRARDRARRCSRHW